MDIQVNNQKTFATTGGKPFDAKKPVAVFIHGAAMDHTVWALQTRYFAHHGCSVLAVDLPGHGRSHGDALRSIDELADWIVALLDAVDVEKATLVGHSMGALTALSVAARHPGRVAGIALLGAAGAMPVHPDLLDAAKANDHMCTDLVNSWAHGRLAHIGGNAQPGLWMIGGCNRLMERAPRDCHYHDLKACADFADGADFAAKVSCPTLLIMGDSDMMSPARKGLELAAAIDGAKSVVIERCGHMMMTERPHETLAALAQIL